MKITVFGASGGIGAHVVDLATQRGHQVRAVYRATPQIPPADQAEILVSRTSSTPLRRPGHPRGRRGRDGPGPGLRQAP